MLIRQLLETVFVYAARDFFCNQRKYKEQQNWEITYNYNSYFKMKLSELSKRPPNWRTETANSPRIDSFYQTEAFKSFHFVHSEGRRFYSIKGSPIKDPELATSEDKAEYSLKKQKYQESINRLQRQKLRRKKIYETIIPSPDFKVENREKKVILKSST